MKVFRNILVAGSLVLGTGAMANCYSSASWPVYHFGSFSAGGGTTHYEANLHDFYARRHAQCRSAGSSYKESLRQAGTFSAQWNTEINLSVRRCQDAMTNRYNARVGRMCD